MEPATLSLILLRVLAVYLIAKGILFAPEIVTVWSGASAYAGKYPNIGLYSFVILTPVIFGLILWLLSPQLAKMIVRGESLKQSVESLSLGNIQAAVLATVGLLIIFVTIPSLISISVQIFGEGGRSSTAATAHLSAQIAKVGLGVVLVFGANSLVRLIRRIREFGLE